jgi:hypothetical protein
MDRGQIDGTEAAGREGGPCLSSLDPVEALGTTGLWAYVTCLQRNTGRIFAPLNSRLDYTPEVVSAWARAAHYCFDHKVFAGLMVPIRRRVVPRRPDDRARVGPTLVWIEIKDVMAVFSWCQMRGVPIAFVLAGGYLGPGLIHRLTLEAACASSSGRKERAMVRHVHVAEKPYNVLTVRDLIEALGWHLVFERRTDEYAGYYHLRFELLSRALGLPSEWTTDQKTPYMIRSLAEAIIHQNFFSRFVEYTPKPGEMKIFDAHRTGIESAQQCVRDRMLDFAEELLLTFWPQVRGKSVRLEELVSMGLPAHEPDDF